jgi:hypothetical protein
VNWGTLLKMEDSTYQLTTLATKVEGISGAGGGDEMELDKVEALISVALRNRERWIFLDVVVYGERKGG